MWPAAAARHISRGQPLRERETVQRGHRQGRLSDKGQLIWLHFPGNGQEHFRPSRKVQLLLRRGPGNESLALSGRIKELSPGLQCRHDGRRRRSASIGYSRGPRPGKLPHRRRPRDVGVWAMTVGSRAGDQPRVDGLRGGVRLEPRPSGRIPSRKDSAGEWDQWRRVDRLPPDADRELLTGCVAGPDRITVYPAGGDAGKFTALITSWGSSRSVTREIAVPRQKVDEA